MCTSQVEKIYSHNNKHLDAVQQQSITAAYRNGEDAVFVSLKRQPYLCFNCRIGWKPQNSLSHFLQNIFTNLNHPRI